MTWLDSWLPVNLVIFFEVTICWAEVALVLPRLSSPQVDLAELQLWVSQNSVSWSIVPGGLAQLKESTSSQWVEYFYLFFFKKKLRVLYLTDLQIWVNWCQLLLLSSLAPSPPSPHCHCLTSPFLTHMAVTSVHPHLVCCCHCDLVIGSSTSASSWLLVLCSECAWKCVHEKLCDRVQDW